MWLNWNIDDEIDLQNQLDKQSKEEKKKNGGTSIYTSVITRFTTSQAASNL